MRTEDGYIIHKCLNGDVAAFGLLVDKYKAGVYALAYSKLHNFHDAEDITQEVFLKAFQKLNTLRFWDNFLAWLYAITSNLCTDLIRSRSKRPDCDYIADQAAEHLDHHSIDSYREDLHYQTLHEALNSLPEKYRQILAFYYLGGMNTKEIGKFLGISPNNVSQRLRQARAELKEEMTEMMSNTYGQHRLHETFTFHIVELIKRIKTSTIPQIPMLPLGLSIAAGIIFVIMGLTSSTVIFDPTDIGSVRIASDEGILSFYDQSVEMLAYADPSLKKNGKEASSQSAAQKGVSDVGEKMNISGKVLKDKIPIPNARVFIHQWNAGIIKEGITKADGSFSLEIPKTEDWRSLTAVAQHSQYSYGWKKPTEDNAENVVIELHNPVTITGTIEDESGKPIPGAEAQISIIHHSKSEASNPRGEYLSGDAIENSMAKTGLDGKFTLTNIPEGASLNLSISGPGYSKDRIYSVMAGSQGLKFKLKREGRIEGYVTLKNGEPATGIKIYATSTNFIGGWEETLTDEEGHYVLANLPAEEYSVLTRTPVKDLVGTIAGYVKVAAGQAVKNIDLKFVEGGFITGKITNKDTNEPIKDHVVNLGFDLRPGPGIYLTDTRTDENGLYRFRAAPGKMMIYLSAPGGYEDVGQLTKHVDVVEGETFSNIDFQFRKGDQLTITGRTISLDGTPVPDVTISDRMEYKQYGKSDKEGNFTISGLRIKQKFSVEANQSEMQMRGFADMEALPGAKAEILMEKYETTSVTGRVVNQQGEPIPGAKMGITHWDKDLHRGSGTNAGVADSSGNYKIAGLIVGDEYYVSANADGYREKNLEPFTPKPNMPSLKDIVLPSAGKYFLEGTVKDTDGKPVARARMIARYHENMVLTDENGHYRLDNLPFAVEVRLNIDHSDYGYSEFWYIPTNQTKNFTLAKATGYLSGKVVDENNVPVENASVNIDSERDEGSGHVNVGARTNLQGEFELKNLLVKDRESVYMGKGMLYKIFKDVEMNQDGVEFVLKPEEPAEQEKPPSAEDTARWEYVKKADERSGKLQGTPAPELDVSQWLYGKPLKISRLKGKVVVLHFWQNEASRDEKTINFINILLKTYGNKGVVFIGIAKPVEELNKLKEFIKEKKAEYPIAVDKKSSMPGAYGATFDKYAVFHTPIFIVIDKDGVIQGRVPDFNLEEKIQESLSK